MLTDVQVASNGRKWHIDHINNARDAAEALRRMDEWIRAELRDCQVRRPEDADGFRWQIIHELTERFALNIHNCHPADKIRCNPPKLPGGGWVAKPGTNVRHP
jgi:hypothetical protein